MNADEVWETTMDPARRVLLQVTIDDAAQADEMFSVLMGEDVEFRRSFIQQNARDVRFLDIDGDPDSDRAQPSNGERSWLTTSTPPK